jgi:hypothetical protein
MFESCDSITIPASVNIIGEKCFSHCTWISWITFANGRQFREISSFAFLVCSSLRSISILFRSISGFYLQISFKIWTPDLSKTMIERSDLFRWLLFIGCGGLWRWFMFEGNQACDFLGLSGFNMFFYPENRSDNWSFSLREIWSWINHRWRSKSMPCPMFISANVWSSTVCGSHWQISFWQWYLVIGLLRSSQF